MRISGFSCCSARSTTLPLPSKKSPQGVSDTLTTVQAATQPAPQPRVLKDLFIKCYSVVAKWIDGFFDAIENLMANCLRVWK